MSERIYQFTHNPAIQLTHIVSTVGLLITVLVSVVQVSLAFSTLDKRISLTEQSVQTVETRRQEDAADIKQQLGELNRKLDQLVERQYRSVKP